MGGEEGVLDSVQRGVIEGGGVGFAIGAARSFFYSSEITAEAAKRVADAKAKNPGLSRAAVRAMTPTAFPAVLTTAGAFAGVTGVFLGTETFLKNMRDKDDMWNQPIAGAIAGSLVGLRRRSIHLSAGCSAAFFFSSIFLHLTGGGFDAAATTIATDPKAVYE